MAGDYYKILGVDKKATDAQIKRAYRRLARKYHPDVNPGDQLAEQRFKEISEAYNVLADSEKRKTYDKFGTIDPSQFAGAGARSSGFNFAGFDFNRSGATSSFADIFDEIFSRKKKPSARPGKGTDLQYVVNLSFTDAIKGITTDLALTRRETCSLCRGKGHILTGRTQTCSVCGGTGKSTMQSGILRFENDCSACGGSGISAGEKCRQCKGAGSAPVRDKITVRIPAGVDNGSRVRVPGKGNAGTMGGPPGDLYIITKVTSHPVFTRKGNNIYLTVPITVTEAALGTKLEVPTIDSKATIRVPPATQSGQRFRLRGRGAKALRGGGQGDQYVDVKIQLPSVIDEGVKELYRKLKRQEHWNPRKGLFDGL